MINVDSIQTLNRSTIECKTEENTLTAWKISESEWYVKVPARYREYTQKYRVIAIYRRFGRIEYYQCRVTNKELEAMESLLGTTFEREQQLWNLWKP